jgi:hypothetical protein
MRTTGEMVNRVLRRLGLAKIVTLGELMVLLECSRRTAQRFLKQRGCLTSYNCNSAYYALPAVVQFDANGLWRYGEARFSRYGNLIETVVGVVCASPAGLTAAELGAQLGVNAHSFVSRLRSHPELYREKMGGTFVYLARNASVRARQTALRRQRLRQTPSLSDAEAVVVLVELIKHPHSSCAELSERVRTRLPRATVAAVEALLRGYGLPKKGAPDSARHGHCGRSSTG